MPDVVLEKGIFENFWGPFYNNGVKRDINDQTQNSKSSLKLKVDVGGIFELTHLQNVLQKVTQTTGGVTIRLTFWGFITPTF